MTSRWRFITPVVALGLVLAACSGGNNTGSAPAGSGGGSLNGATVTVIGTWTDVEQTNFLAMVKPWEDQTGAKVKYQGTRSINDILAAGIPTGVLPDLAGLPGPGQMAEYANAGALKPLDDVLDVSTYTSETSPGLVKLGQVSGKTYGVFIKASIKGLTTARPRRRPGTISRPKPRPTRATPRRSGASASAPVMPQAGPRRTGSSRSCCARLGPMSTTAGGRARPSGPIPLSSRRSTRT